MTSPLRDLRGPGGRLPERPGPLRQAAALLYGGAAWLAGAVAACCAERIGMPVISVGNLEVGGTGKTPATEALARLALAGGRRPGIVTGMAGQGGGRRLLRSGEPDFAAHAPDEARLLALRLGDVPVVAARRKRDGARRLAREGVCELLILDDGFQHRRLARDRDLVLLSADPTLSAGRVLPAGPLRELPGALRRADALLLPEGASPPGLPARPRFAFRVVPEGLFDLEGRPVSEDPAGYLAVSAIARPERFEAMASDGRILLERMRFRDHASWGKTMRRELAAALERLGSARPLLTQKDALRWQGSWDLPGKAPFYLGIHLEFSDPTALWAWLEPVLARGGSPRDGRV